MELPGRHGTCEGCAEIGGGTPCGHPHWGHRWSSLGATKRVRGIKWSGRRHANAPTEALGGAASGAMTRASKRAGGRHEGLALGFFGGVPLCGHEACAGCAEMGGGTPRGPCHWGLRWSSLCGHATCEGCAEMGGADACGRCHLGLRWSSPWGHETLSWVGWTHADGAAGAFGGAPDGATKRCPGWVGRMRAVPLGPSVELPRGPRSV